MQIDRTKRARVSLFWIGLASVGWGAAPPSGKQVKALDAYFQLPFSFEPTPRLTLRSTRPAAPT